MQWTALKDYEQNFGIHGAGLEDDDDTSSVELQRLIARKFGVNISTAAICTYLHKSLADAIRKGASKRAPRQSNDHLQVWAKLQKESYRNLPILAQHLNVWLWSDDIQVCSARCVLS